MTTFNEKWQKCHKKTKKNAFGKTAEFELQKSQKHFTASVQTKTHRRV